MTSNTPDVLLLPQAMDAMQLGVIILGTDGRVTLWNRWMEQHSGISCNAALTRHFGELFPDLSGTRLMDAINCAAQQHLPSVLSPSLHRSPLPLFQKLQDKHVNRRMHQMIHVVPLMDHQDSPSILVQVTDMTATVNREQLLRQQAAELKRSNHTDALTGIANRRYFDEKLAEEFRRAQRSNSHLALAMVDIDYFKLYNDYYGHLQGDQCLVRVASALQNSLKRAGDLATRYGGEEFAIILPGMDEKAASELARDLCLRVAALGIAHSNSPVDSHITISVGVASLVPEHGTQNFSALVSSADVALYEAKTDGRNRAMLFSIADGTFQACI